MSSDANMIVEAMYSFFIIGIVVSSAIGVYGAYWSLTIRKSLVVRIYKRQELIVGIWAVYGIILSALFYFVYFFEPSLRNTYVGLIQSILYLFSHVIVLAWLDSSIRIGSKLDPLRRDPLHWSSIFRWIIWTLMGLSLIIVIVYSGGNVASSSLNTVARLGVISTFILLAVPTIPLFLVAKSSGDPFYRRSIEWFGIGVVILIILNVGFSILYAGNGVVYTPANLAWTIVGNFLVFPFIFYSFYRCARALVPLNRIEL